MKRLVNILESVVVLAIILVLIQTLLEDLVVVLELPVSLIKILIITGFCFDLFFTIEFFTRFISAVSNGKVIDYIVYKRGWVDFIASLPLLVLSSGPNLYFILTSSSALVGGVIGSLNILKIIKAIRVTRILRLLRVMKIFGKIKNTESHMAQRHVSSISTIVVTGFISFLILFSIVKNYAPFSKEKKIAEKENTIGNTIADLINKNNVEKSVKELQSFLDIEQIILVIEYEKKVIFQKYSLKRFRSLFYYGDTSEYRNNDKKINILFSRKELNKEYSAENLLYFSIVIMLVIILLLVYSRHFALTISDPLYVMYKGFTDPEYTLEVKILKPFIKDEIFDLAKIYNEKWLDTKIKKMAKEAPEVKLSLDDIFPE